MLPFYLIYVIFYIIYRLINSSQLIYLILCGVLMIYEPALFFLAGRDTMRRKKCLSSVSAFRISMAGKALGFFSFYIVAGVTALVLLKKQGLYMAVRNILAVNTVPGLCGIFASLGFLYLLAGLLLPYADPWRKKGLIAVILAVFGFLMVFIPKKIIGYALIGLFIGGDRFGCVPVATHLAAFFWGMYTLSPGKLSLRDKWNWVIMVVLILCSVFSLLLRQKDALILCAGTLAAFFAVTVESLFLPLITKLEPFYIRCVFFLKESIISLDSNSNRRILGKENRKRLLMYFSGYLILFLFTALMVFLPILQRGQSLVWTGDALSQYIPKLHRFLRYIPEVFRSLTQGRLDIPQYDYSSGLGSTVAISFDPLYWLFLILPKQNLDLTYTVMTMVRYFLAGVSLSIMLIYFRQSCLACYAASLAYSFSGYALYAGTRHFQFITPLILLPLLVVSMERLIHHGKWYMFTALVAFSLLCSYYFLYMNTIALGLYFISRILCTKELRNLQTFLGRGLTVVFGYILGASMGVISIATSFGSYLGSGRSQGGKLAKLLAGNPLYYRQSWIQDVFLSFISYNFSPGYWLKIGTVPLALLGAVLLFTRKSRKEARVLFCILTSFCFLPIAGFIFGGFSGVTNRWSYIYTVLSGFLIASCLDEMNQLTQKDVIFLTGVTVYYGLLVFFDPRMQFMTMYADLAFLALTLCVILMLNTRKFSVPSYAGKILVSGITILTLIFNGTHFLDQKKENGKPVASYTTFNSLERISATSLKDLEQIPGYDDSTEFFRSTNLKGSADTNCFSMINGHNDIATFTSTQAGSIVDYNRMMGNCDWTTVRVFDYNFRTFMHALASVKYIGFVSEYYDNFQSLLPYGYKKVYTTKEGVPIYENEYALPIAYTYDTLIPASRAEKESVIRRQELTMTSAIVDDEIADSASLRTEQSTTELLSHELPYEIVYDGIEIEEDLLTIKKPEASMTLTFESDPNAETYIIYSGQMKKIDEGKSQTKKVIIDQNEMEYIYRFRTDAYNTNQQEHVLNLGYHKDKIYSCTLTFKTPGTINFKSLSVYSQPMDHYEEMINARRENVLENVLIQNNTITGSIELDRDKMLVIAFPYQNGWTAYVDGKEVPICRANYQYMGLDLKSGRHDIRLHYQIPGLVPAFKVTAAGLFVFVLIIIFNRYRKKRSLKN